MSLFQKSKNILNLEIDTQALRPDQIRLIKSINSMIIRVLETDDESEYFETSAEVIRMAASIITLSNLSHELECSEIPYSIQAIEYSMEVLSDHIGLAKVVSYDN